MQFGALLLSGGVLGVAPSHALQPRVVEVPAGPAFGSGLLCLECKSFRFSESSDPLSALVAVILRWLSFCFPMALNGFACSQDG